MPTRRDAFVVTCHPDHIKSLFTAKPDDAPSVTAESPLRPILGPNSVLNLIGPRHMRQRKLLLPPFHGEAVKQYMTMISEVAEREIDRWEPGRKFALAPRMQAVTLDVIMAGIFGIEGGVRPGTLEYQLKETLRGFLRMSTRPYWAIVELQNMGHPEPRGLLRMVLSRTDKLLYEVIRQRRAAGARGDGRDVLSLLLEARDEDGQPLSDAELRDELDDARARRPRDDRQLARLDVRAAGAHARRLRAAARAGPLRGRGRGRRVRRGHDLRRDARAARDPDDRPAGAAAVAARRRTSFRRGRRWRSASSASSTARTCIPSRTRSGPSGSSGSKPGTYTWIPFGGGIRRCLGASLAMAEQRWC